MIRRFLVCFLLASVAASCGDDPVQPPADDDDDDPGTPMEADPLLLSRIDAGPAETCGITSAGEMLCWGHVMGSESSEPTEVGASRVWTEVSLSGRNPGQGAWVIPETYCAIDDAGDVYCWGLNVLGQAGGLDTYISTPRRQDLLGPATSVATADSFSCASGPAGTQCWGSVYGWEVTRTIGDGLHLVHMDAHTNHACGVDTDGGVWCWGGNSQGQNGTEVESYTEPAQVALSGPATEVATGGMHSCALLASGEVWCWGRGTRGQLGGEPLSLRDTTPRKVEGRTFGHIWAGLAMTCGLSDGEAVCWGENAAGQLGSADSVCEEIYPCVTSPTALDSSEEYVELALGDDHVCGRTAEGEVWCWGANQWHQSCSRDQTIMQEPAQVMDPR